MWDISWHVGKYKHSRFWAVREGGPSGNLVCLCVYLRGAREVVRRLGGPEIAKPETLAASVASDRRKGAVK